MTLSVSGVPGGELHLSGYFEPNRSVMEEDMMFDEEEEEDEEEEVGQNGKLSQNLK